MAGMTRDGSERLAEKLRSEYRNRGAALNGVEATSTSELMKRAQMGRDPKVNVSAEAFDDRMQGRTFRDGGYGAAHGTSAQRTAPQYGTRGTSARSRNDGVNRDGMGGCGAATSGAGHSFRGEDGAKRVPGGGSSAGRSAKGTRGTKGARTERTASHEEPLRVRFAEEEDVFEEIRVERKRIPAGFLLVLVFFTVMIMLILTSVAQIYQTTREISDLEDEVVTLKETIDDLELKLDEKNDIRLIEQMATAELGMVKEDSLQKKYISLSEGEHVDIIGEKTEEEDAGGGSTMLSGFFEMFGGVFEYFK